MKSTQFFSKLRLFNSVYEAGAMISLKNPKQFLLVLAEIGWRVISLSTLSGTKVTSRVRLLHNFGKYLIRMNQKHGSLYVVKYLKACQIAIQRKVSGLPFKSLREIEPDYPLPRLSKSGLPVIIKLADRRAICVSGVNTIRLYLSIFGLYRIISAPVRAKLNTITDGFSGDTKFMVSVAE